MFEMRKVGDGGQRVEERENQGGSGGRACRLSGDGIVEMVMRFSFACCYALARKRLRT
jgi:hypothetical protein